MSEKLKRKREDEDATGDPLVQDSDRKREKLDESGGEVIPKDNKVVQNTFLVEALKKIVELQNEINDFEDSSSEEEDEDELLNADEYEAEALGFAMCARETLLFLQNEGLSQDDPIFRALRDRLIGRCQGVPI